MNRNLHLNARTTPITRDRLQRLVPSAFAAQPHPKMSTKYRYIPTSTVLDALMETGFVPVKAAEARTRLPDNEDFVRHLIVFRQPQQNHPLALNEVVPEMTVLNSHNGSSAYLVHAGLLRFICVNGTVVSDGDFGAVRVRHSGTIDIVDAVINASTAIVRQMPALFEKVQNWRELSWSRPTQMAYATEALKLRWPKAAPIDAYQLLQAQRNADAGSSPWLTFNRVQENLIKGNQRYTVSGKPRHTRAVDSINTDLRINTRLWALTDNWARGEMLTVEQIFGKEQDDELVIEGEAVEA